MKIVTVGWFCVLLFSVGCRKQSVLLDQGWSTPVKITETRDSLGGGIVLYKLKDTVLAAQGQGDMSAKFFLMNSKDNVWSEVSLKGVPQGYYWAWPAVDAHGELVCFKQDYMQDDQLEISVLVGQLSTNGGLAIRDATEKKWATDKNALLGQTGPNIHLTEPGRRSGSALGLSFQVADADLYIPYFVRAYEIIPRGTSFESDSSRGPFGNGVLRSADSGRTWQVESITNIEAWDPSVRVTRAYCYFFAVKMDKEGASELCFARKSTASGSWTELSVVARTYGYRYIAVPQDDTMHLCWMDRRHERLTGNLEHPHAGNFELVYSRRADSDAAWSKDVILSTGLVYAASPSMSVEGDRIVIAWAGIQSAGVWHSQYDPNDIYFVTSKDAGKNWAKPLRLTDNIKLGITAGDPQVVLQNGIIHLTYIQGKLNLKQESPGLTKLNQPPWPIYYQQRPYPE